MNAVLGAGIRESGLWKSVWKLLYLRLVIMINGFRRAKLRRKIGLIALGVVFLGLIVFVFVISILILDFLRSPSLGQYVTDIGPFLEMFPTLIISAATVGILLTSFSVLLQGLYLSGDMDFLMSTPLPLRSIFVAKLVEAVLPNFLAMCLFTLPVLYGLGISSGYNFLYYPVVLLLLAALTLAAAGLASLLVMGAVRVFPAKRLAEVIGFTTGMAIFIFSQSSQLFHFDVNSQQVSNLLSLTERFNQPWSPLTWAGQGLVMLGKAEWLGALGLLGVVLALAGGIFYVSLTSAERLYYTGWSRLQNNRRKARSAAQPRGAVTIPGADLLAGLLSRPVRAILIKDWTLYRRDLRSMSKLLTPLIMGVVYAFSLIRSGGALPAESGDAPEWVMTALQGIFLYGDVALSLFVGWMLAMNMAGSGVSLEGKNYWLLKAAPVSPRQFLAAKYLTAYLPGLLVCGTYDLILQVLKKSDLWSTVLSLLATALVLAGVNGIYLAFGIIGAKFDWDNPNQIGRSVGCLGNLAGMFYLPLCFGLFAGPPLLAGFLGFPLVFGQLIGLFLGGAAGLAGALVPLALVEKRVSTLNET